MTVMCKNIGFCVPAVLILACIFAGCDTNPSDTPSAVISTSSSSVETGVTITFDGTDSSTSESKKIEEYAWAFGDGTSDTGSEVSHAYQSAGTYTVVLTVTDDDEQSGTASLEVTVTLPPVVISEMTRTDPGTSDDTISLSWETDRASECTVYFGRIPDASNTVFYIGGNDASPGEDGAVPAEGGLYGVERIVIHPNYAGAAEYDIALLQLSEPVSGVAPAGYNTSAMTSGDYVGAGRGTAGFDASLTGVKKQQYLTIDSVYAQSFYTEDPESCLGDSGIIMLDADEEVLGISSAVYPSDSDPFFGATILVRADSHDAWIQGVMAE